MGDAWAKAQEYVCECHVLAGGPLRGWVLVSQKYDDASVFPARPVIEAWMAPEGQHLPKRYPLARQTLLEDGWKVEVVEPT
jgi:hypothetical protein